MKISFYEKRGKKMSVKRDGKWITLEELLSEVN
jgi:hypothetical protein